VPRVENVFEHLPPNGKRRSDEPENGNSEREGGHRNAGKLSYVCCSGSHWASVTVRGSPTRRRALTHSPPNAAMAA
jgi:hypothetical protein